MIEDQLIEFAKELTWHERKSLQEIEDPLAELFHVNMFRDLSPTVRHYLSLTSLPFYISRHDLYDSRSLWAKRLKRLWHIPPDERPYTPVSGHLQQMILPTGNIYAKYVVVGDIPSAGYRNTNLRDFARSFSSERPHHILKEALDLLDMHPYTWYTNIMKAPSKYGHQSSKEEYLPHLPLLIDELEVLKPELILLLGASAEKRMPEVNYPTIAIPNPSSVIRLGKSTDWYAEQISNAKEQHGC